MSDSEFRENFPKLLDDILLSFSNDFNIPKSIDELKTIVFKKQLSKEYTSKNVDKNFDRFFKETDVYYEFLDYLLSFLHQEKLIVYNKSSIKAQSLVTITSKGFFKIKTESFHEKIRNDKYKTRLQISVWIVALLSFFITIFNQFITIRSSNVSINCICNKP